jgi:hypothetical protein
MWHAASHEPLNERAPLASGALKTFGVKGVKEATYIPSEKYRTRGPWSPR